MNYIQLINRLWRLRLSHHITSLQADLYLALVNECNLRRWENPFQCKNDRIISATGMSCSSMERARGVITKLGLVQYKQGVQNSLAPVYSFLEEEAFLLYEKSLKPIPSEDYNRVLLGDAGGYSIGNKQNKTETFATIVASGEAAAGTKKNAAVAGGAEQPPEPEKEKGCGQKEKEDKPVPHWRAVVSKWFSFFEEQYEFRPSFKGRDPKALREIMLLLEKRRVSAGGDWTEDTAVHELQLFLSSAHQDSFLKKKFLLKNLEEQYDAIISHQYHNTFAGQPTGIPGPSTAQPPVARGRGATFADIQRAQRTGM